MKSTKQVDSQWSPQRHVRAFDIPVNPPVFYRYFQLSLRLNLFPYISCIFSLSKEIIKKNLLCLFDVFAALPSGKAGGSMWNIGCNGDRKLMAPPIKQEK